MQPNLKDWAEMGKLCQNRHNTRHSNVVVLLQYEPLLLILALNVTN